ncbi:MAG: GDP-L-fucose synthase [Methanomicrobiales archaeon]|jgi:GDP-L-fucose synthase|nr:GDP-L-fucose synthase [Methanomicrobiales archaeon]
MGYFSDKKILVTGGAGFLGKRVVHFLIDAGADPSKITTPKSRECDLRVYQNCIDIVSGKDLVIHLAARVGGIGYNREHAGELFYDNIMMGAQIIEAARRAQVSKVVAIGTVCAYPKYTPVPFHEADLWNGYPEETNAPYGLAKKMLLVQAQAYREQYGMNTIFLLPVNLYGPNDNFDPESSHVIPALIRKFVEAKRYNVPQVEVWGTGSASREFLYVDDAARAIVMAAETYNEGDPINIGAGFEITIRELVELIRDLTEYGGEIVWDRSKPDGQPRRCLDVSLARLKFGFHACVSFPEGLQKTIEWYKMQKMDK